MVAFTTHICACTFSLLYVFVCQHNFIYVVVGAISTALLVDDVLATAVVLHPTSAIASRDMELFVRFVSPIVAAT